MTRLQLALGLACGVALSGCGVQHQVTPDLPPRTTVVELDQDVDYLKHEQENYAIELRMFTGKLDAMENVVSQLRDEFSSYQKDQGRQTVAQLRKLESELLSLTQSVKEHAELIRTLSLQGNEMANSLKHSHGKGKELEQALAQQGKNIKNLEGALNSLLALEQHRVDSRSSAESASLYTVQPGDTLEKIAKRHRVTVSALKRVNRLDRDLIVIGQKLRIPAE